MDLVSFLLFETLMLLTAVSCFLITHIDLREAIPGLIRVVEIEQGHVAARAAGALEHYRDPRALPALRKAAGEHLGGGWEREAFLRAMPRS